MRVTNRGTSKWEVSPGVFVRPGESAEVSPEGWRLALALNAALAAQVGRTIEVEEGAQAIPAVLSEPDYAEPSAGDEPTPAPPPEPEKKRRGRR